LRPAGSLAPIKAILKPDEDKTDILREARERAEAPRAREVILRMCGEHLRGLLRELLTRFCAH
jgi:hypothetical protein